MRQKKQTGRLKEVTEAFKSLNMEETKNVKSQNKTWFKLIKLKHNQETLTESLKCTNSHKTDISYIKKKESDITWVGHDHCLVGHHK